MTIATALLCAPASAAVPRVSVGDAAATEGSAAVRFAVRLSRPSRVPVAVRYTTVAGTAAASEFARSSGRLVFKPGKKRRVVAVALADDSLDEDAESFGLKLLKPRRARLGDRLGRATIADDDAEPTLRLGDGSFSEGTGGSVAVLLSGPSAKTVTVAYATAAGTAAAGRDFATARGTLSFAPGETERVVPLATLEDSLDEFDETFSLGLAGPVNATVADGAAALKVLDDDSPPALSVGDVSASEGTSGSTIFSVPVSLSAPSGKTVSADFATADGSAGAGDYSSATGTLSFAPGVLTRQVQVTVTSDWTDEPDENLSLVLSSPQNATLADAQALVTILDDDEPCGDVANVVWNLGFLSGDTGSPVITRNDAIDRCGDRENYTFDLTENNGNTSRNLTATVTLDWEPNDSPGDGMLSLCVRPTGSSTLTCGASAPETRRTVCILGHDMPFQTQQKRFEVIVTGVGAAANGYTLELRGNAFDGDPGDCIEFT